MNTLFMMMFFLVLASEINVYGFVLAVLHFGNIPQAMRSGMVLPNGSLFLMRAALILGFLSYCAAMATYLWNQFQKNQQAKKQKEEMDRISDATQDDSWRTSDAIQDDSWDMGQIDIEYQWKSEYKMKQRHCCEHMKDDGLRPVHCLHHTSGWTVAQIHLYHFLPVCRWIVVLKSLLKHEVHDDAEALHKTYTLSTFTLGFVQVVCVLISTGESVLRVDDMALKLVFANLILSFLLTLVHNFTSIPGRMKDAARIEELKILHIERSKNDLVSLHSGSDVVRAKTLQTVHVEIRELAQVISNFHFEVGSDGTPEPCTAVGSTTLPVDVSAVDLDTFSAHEICLVRTCLYIKHFKWCCGCCAKNT
jgi:hypothetical protein